MLVAPAPLVLIGYRRPALEVALRRGPTIVAVDRPPPRSARASDAVFVDVDLSDPGAALAALRGALGDARPAGVVALVERSVAVAAALAEAYDLPGIRPAQVDLFRDKARMKERARAAGIPTAAHIEVRPGAPARDLVEALGLPLVLKPRRSSGSRDLVIARSLADVRAAVDRAAQGELIAEELIKGVEMSVESLVAGGEIIFTNPTEYLIHGHASVVPAGISAVHLERALALNAEVLEAFAIRDGITHLELFISQEDYVLGEVAARPPGGYLMDLIASAYGFDPYAALFAIACGERPQVTTTAQATAAALVIHPGAGEVVRVDGVDAIAALPGVDRVRCSLRPGDRLSARKGVGESKGWVLLRGDDRPALLRVLRQVQGLLDIELRPVEA